MSITNPYAGVDVLTVHDAVCEGGRRDGMRFTIPDYINEYIIFAAPDDPAGTYHRTADKDGARVIFRWTPEVAA